MDSSLEGGAYEIIRNRLAKQSQELTTRLDALNQARQTTFGAIQSTLLATERVTTEYNCIARDMVSIGANRFLFGYNVQMGLKSTTAVGDVFAVYDFDPQTLTFRAANTSEILGDAKFQDDFLSLYRYYKNTFFTKASLIGPHLYMVMQTGRDIADIKAFKWLKNGDGTMAYLGNRFDHEYVFPPQIEFEWKRARRDMHRTGDHPHISIEDRLFVETVGGDLTVKIEDNTSTGQGIYSEDVADRDQTLDDAEIFYAIVGSLILLKILPYQEKQYRYLVYCEKIQKVYRIDGIADSCVLLPDDHGIIFSSGYVLQTGEVKLFDNGLRNMLFEQRIPASNGEDFLYAFFNRESGEYILLAYNLIARTVQTPIVCNGYSLFPNGELLCFKASDQPQKHHAVQIWRTPFVDGAIALKPAAENGNTFLHKIGNAEIVRCMAECQAILTLLAKDDTYADLYVDLVKASTDLLDTYFWLDKPEAHNLNEPLREIRAAAEAAIDEFEKVRRLRQIAAESMQRTSEKAGHIIRSAETAVGDGIIEYVRRLTALRELRGEIIGLKDVRYADSALIETLEKQTIAAGETLSKRCVEFLLQPAALDPYRTAVADQQTAIGKISKVIEAAAIEEALTKTGTELEMLIGIVGNLKIDDATQTTRIIDDISAIYATLNQVKVELRNRRKDFARVEGAAQFSAQLKLLSQAAVNYLDLADAPAKCDEFQARLFVQIEELEGRFAEFEEYVEQLTTKRVEIGDAFEQRRQALAETRNRRAASLLKSGERILQGITRRVEALTTVTEIHGYLASDLMVEKLREIVRDLAAIGENVKADDLQTRLKTVREDAVRQLKDRQELFIGGADLIQLGAHRFTVNKQPLDLAVIARGEGLAFHLTGTAFYEAIEDAPLNSTKAVWEQELPSENNDVYRAEYLAWLFAQTLHGRLTAPEGVELPASPAKFLALTPEAQLETVQRFIAPQYTAGWNKGVHDYDALLLACPLLTMESAAGLLRFPPEVRTCALVAWNSWPSDPQKETLAAAIRSFGALQRTLGSLVNETQQTSYIARLAARIAEFQGKTSLFAEVDPHYAAEYLFAELTDPAEFTVSDTAHELCQRLARELTHRNQSKALENALAPLRHDPVAAFESARDWLLPLAAPEQHTHATEAAVHLVRGYTPAEVRCGTFQAEITGLRGSHRIIGAGGTYTFAYHPFTAKLRRFTSEIVPLYQRYQQRKTELVRTRRESLRLDEFKPKVMTSFVRNRLINDVYLPLVGANLAKQIGAAGADTRTDRSGLLLLISPPGYGKTTLMEYVANRLGLTFVKINGPALGNRMTSLDPAEAPNASARQEIQRLNLALEMGDNVMLYVDDIQHCHPEFLQKFISLCDAQRKIEGVYQGQARTYDLRGKKVAVVMAGNPYTESGDRFRIPDMLSNRADTYNLGDILGGHETAFQDSYIENALTSNPVLSRLAARSQKDVYAILHIARTGTQEGADFEGSYAIEEIEEMVNVTKKLISVRDIVLKVNAQYIHSAGQTDAYRTEPAFKLQGSYRNMNRIAEKVLPLLTEEELRTLVLDHYRSESQTLTTGAEANLLKFKELLGWQTKEESTRWEEIKTAFRRQQLLGGNGENDPVTRIVAQLATFAQGLEAIEAALKQVHETRLRPATLADETLSQLEKVITGLRAVPVNLDIKVVPLRAEQEGEKSEGTSTVNP